VTADYAGALKPGAYHVRLMALLGGDFAGGVAGKPAALCEFSTELK